MHFYLKEEKEKRKARNENRVLREFESNAGSSKLFPSDFCQGPEAILTNVVNM